MTNDDESFLSAYMDGQLDPERQQRVESALAASPQLAERMRGLVLVRDMVAGLPRDGSVDVRARVMQQIRARQRRGFLPTLEGWRHGSRRILPLAGLATTAASLMVAASLAILVQTSQNDRGGPAVGELADALSVAPKDPVVLPAAVPVDAKDTAGVPQALVASSHSDIAGAHAEGTPLASAEMSDPGKAQLADATEVAANHGLEQLRPFLDNARLKRFFLVESGPKTDSETTVASIVEHTTHLDFFRISVPQGIVIDPLHPDRATVFAVSLEARQVDRFHEQLKMALPGLVEQRPLDPSIATQLAELSAVQSRSPVALDRVEIPRDALALRDAGDPPSGLEAPRPPDQVPVGRQAVKERENRVVVLVWVAEPPAK